jgi:uracil-DNA glycosylase
MTAGRVIVIGQAPSRDGNPERPLLGPPGKEGLLYRLSGAVNREQFEAVFEPRNLLAAWPGHAKHKGDSFPAKKAKVAADGLRPSLSGRRVVLLGIGVAKAFGFKPSDARFTWAERDGVRFALSPHPSLINLWWNNPRNRAEAARFFGSILTGDR